MRDWFKPKLVRDIQVFIGFANFYRRFIQGFSKIVALPTLMLKTSAGDIDSTVSDKKRNRFSNKISKTTKSKSASSGSVFLTLKAKLTFI